MAYTNLRKGKRQITRLNLKKQKNPNNDLSREIMRGIRAMTPGKVTVYPRLEYDLMPKL